MIEKLRQIIPLSIAVNSLLLVNFLIVLFHLGVLLQLIPYTIVWAGKLNTIQEMYVFESVSIVLNLIFILLLLKRKSLFQKKNDSKFVRGIFLVFSILFFLNTIGNLFAQSWFELLTATPLTFVLAIFSFRLSLKDIN